MNTFIGGGTTQTEGANYGRKNPKKHIKAAARHLERCPCAVFFDNFADFARLKKPAVGAGGREGSKTTLGQCRRR